MRSPGPRPLLSEAAAKTCRSAAAREGHSEEEHQMQSSSTQLTGLHLFSVAACSRLDSPGPEHGRAVRGVCICVLL